MPRFYSAELFNRWVAFARSCYAVAGQGCELTYRPDGIIVTGDAAVLGEHPWKLRCHAVPREDDPEKIEWRATVRPGFVNGRDASISMTATDPKTRHPVTTQSALTDDPRPHLVLAGWRNPVQSAGVTASLAGEIIAQPGEGYPPFFASIGVKPAAKGGALNKQGALAAEPDPLRTRELRALDVALIVPRIATRSEVTLLNPLTDGQTLSISSVTVNDYARTAPAAFHLVTRTKWQAPREPDILERMQGTAVEPQTDELKMATVWMVSPPDAEPDAEPDATWTPYPQHFVFWNLLHASRRQPGRQPDKPLELRTGLALGLGDALFAALLSPVNDAFAQIDAFFSGANYKGEFWT